MNKEDIKIYNKNYYQKNKEKMDERHKKYRKKYREKENLSNQIRYTKKRIIFLQNKLEKLQENINKDY
jgi:hypothetical protein